MQQIMDTLRENHPTEVGGTPVAAVRDYLTGEMSVEGLGKVGETPISGSNVLYFELADGSSFIIRPSGTEPKIKIYLLVRDANREICASKIERFAAYAETLKDI